MQRKLLGIISVGFDITGQLLIDYIIGHFSDTSEKMGIQSYDASAICRVQESLFVIGNPLKLVWLIKMCLNETYNRVLVGNHLSDRFERGKCFIAIAFQLCSRISN
jgi:hypothetical protein